jgi:hypothetical protein
LDYLAQCELYVRENVASNIPLLRSRDYRLDDLPAITLRKSGIHRVDRAACEPVHVRPNHNLAFAHRASESQALSDSRYDTPIRR